MLSVPSNGYRAAMAAATDGPSVAELVHEVLRSADQPLTLPEVVIRVSNLVPIRTVNPLATVRGALSQGAQLVNVGDGRFGYLPRLINGSLLRLPLKAESLADRPLIYPEDVRLALFPSFFEIQKRKRTRPAQLRLPGATTAEISLEHVGSGAWGCVVPAALHDYLATERAVAGGALLIRAIDAETGVYEARLESPAQRDAVAVAQRNEDLASLVEGLIGRSRTHDLPIWDIVVALLARGAYQVEPAPDPIEGILAASPRFADDEFGIWTLEPHQSAPPNDTPKRARAQARRRGGRGTRVARDLVSAIEALAERLQSEPRVVTAKRTGREIADASRVLRDLLEPEASRTPRRHHTRWTEPKLLQLKCTLKNVRPPIWRRLMVRSDTPLDRLHHILQLAMAWSDSHLHEFVANGAAYGIADEEWSNDVEDECHAYIADVASVAGDRLLYRYDFGDGWECDLVIEKVLVPQPGVEYPLCVNGRRAGPPEDVGGVWGYAQFLDALADPTHSEHEQHVEWAGGDFDPEEFDPARVSALLREFAHDRTLVDDSR